jgi:phage terminase large subunit-like protein
LITFPPLFPLEAEAGLAVFKELRLVDVLNRPTLGEAGRPWLFDFVSSIFGSYDNESGRRLITEYFLLISKKNSKSTGAAAIMLTALIRNWRESAEFTILAPTVEIANNSFFPARDMVKANDELSDLMHVQEHYRQITHRGTGAVLKVVAADAETVGGKKATGVLVDELWLFGKRPNAENMLREACGGLASRPEGFVIYLSTQSDEAPAGIFAEKLEYARKVRDGKVEDNRFLPVIYEYPKNFIDDKKYMKPKYFYVTNPNLGASVDEEFLKREFMKAAESGKESQQGFFAKHLNIQISMSARSSRWAGVDSWESCGGAVSLDTIFDECDVLTIGIDGGGSDDFLGFAVLGRVKPPKGVDYGTPEYMEIADSLGWLLWTRAWVQSKVLELRKSEAARFRDFARDGDLIIIDRPGPDLRQVGELVMQCEESGLLDRIGVDPAGINDIVTEIAVVRRLPKINPNSERHDRIMSIPQGWRMAGSIKTLERRLASGTVMHSGSALMAWCVGNAKVEVSKNAYYLTKTASGIGKIDPLIAAINATALMSMMPEPRRKTSIYETRGVITIG